MHSLAQHSAFTHPLVTLYSPTFTLTKFISGHFAFFFSALPHPSFHTHSLDVFLNTRHTVHISKFICPPLGYAILYTHHSPTLLTTPTHSPHKGRDAEEPPVLSRSSEAVCTPLFLMKRKCTDPLLSHVTLDTRLAYLHTSVCMLQRSVYLVVQIFLCT